MKAVISAASSCSGEGVQIGFCGAALLMRIFSPIVEPSGLRAEFPVLREKAYMNAGTDGPIPRQAVEAAQAELERELTEGRAMAHFERRSELARLLRGAYAEALGAEPSEISLTTCTTEGM